jgi:pyruvate formate lyase activating enzyme
MEAQYYNRLENSFVQCTLCPHNCRLRNGKIGVCRIRKNTDGMLEAETYYKFSAVSFDPIEKKPLYHFHPGKEILSIGSLGCNMHCNWCQNCEISQAGIEENVPTKYFSPDQLLLKAKQRQENIGIAFTYNEPGIAFESNIEIAKLFKKEGFINALISNGYLNSKPLQEYLEYIDAVNLDIKGFDPGKHKRYTGATLQPVLENAKTIFGKGIHLELTYLVVTGVNDSEKEFQSFLQWITSELSANVPLHISRYFPRYNFHTQATPTLTLKKFSDLASDKLKFVYLGNYYSEEYHDTHCSGCNQLLVQRKGYHVLVSSGAEGGECPKCGEKVFVS